MRVHWIYKLIVMSVFTAVGLTVVWTSIDVARGAANPAAYAALFLGVLIGYWFGWFQRGER